MSRWVFQSKLAKARGAVICEWSEKLEPEKLIKYFPDITNQEFQRVFLFWVGKQIMCGVDSIWIDMLFIQTRIMERFALLKEDSKFVETSPFPPPILLFSLL